MYFNICKNMGGELQCNEIAFDTITNAHKDYRSNWMQYCFTIEVDETDFIDEFSFEKMDKDSRLQAFMEKRKQEEMFAAMDSDEGGRHEYEEERLTGFDLVQSPNETKPPMHW